jgi:hypothetical protein
MPIEFRSRIPAAKAITKQAITQATLETFELDIKPDAVKRSPVTPEGYAHNLELLAEHKLGGRRASGTGANRNSIDTETSDTPEGPKATLFTQSGHGGYLEVGTSKMRAQPYLYPAFIEHVDKIPERVKEKIAEAGEAPQK